jgi:hypothetical protein
MSSEQAMAMTFYLYVYQLRSDCKKFPHKMNSLSLSLISISCACNFGVELGAELPSEHFKLEYKLSSIVIAMLALVDKLLLCIPC